MQEIDANLCRDCSPAYKEEVWQAIAQRGAVVCWYVSNCIATEDTLEDKQACYEKAYPPDECANLNGLDPTSCWWRGAYEFGCSCLKNTFCLGLADSVRDELATCGRSGEKLDCCGGS